MYGLKLTNEQALLYASHVQETLNFVVIKERTFRPKCKIDT